MSTGERLRQALHEVTAPIEAPTLDTTELIRRGRAVRRRRVTIAAAAAAVLALAVSGALAFHPVRPAEVGVRPEPSAPPTTPSAVAVTSAPATFPDPTTTGAPTTTKLTRHSGNVSIRTDGTVIDGWDLTGSIDVYANNVTIRNSRITSSNWWGVNLRTGYTGLKVLNSTIVGVAGAGPDHGGEDYGVASAGGAVEVGGSDISGFGSLVAVGRGSVHDNYLHGVRPVAGDGGKWQGSNGIVADAASGLTIRHNTVLNETPAERTPTCAVGLFADSGPVTDVVVEGNLLAGGAYTFYGGDPGATRVRVTGNRFSTRVFAGGGVYGPVAHWNAGGTGNVWRDNAWADGPSAGRAISP